jgi:hypothetical protein
MERSGASRKRPIEAEADELSSSSRGQVLIDLDELTRLRACETTLVQLSRPIFTVGVVYDMDKADDKERLAAALWTASVVDSLEALKTANQPLVAVLRAQIANQSNQTEAFLFGKELLIEGILTDLVRAQSQKSMTLLTAAGGILGHVNHLTREMHDFLTLYHKGALPSESWVEDILKRARKYRPSPALVMLRGVAVATFDNLVLTINVDFKSYVTDGEGGHKMDMTNWFSTLLPRELAPAGFNAEQICECAA